MPYLRASDLPTQNAGDRFRALLARPGILGIPGTHNGLAAQQAKAAGFEALYLSGAAMTASMGLPDLGIITVDEVCFFIRQVTRASAPGSGRRRHRLRRSAQRHEHGPQFRGCRRRRRSSRRPDPAQEMRPSERQETRHAHDMAAKIAAAAHARRHLYIIARTDAAASEGIDGAVARAKLYMQAGADAIFPGGPEHARRCSRNSPAACRACRCSPT